jgi:transketolase
MGRDDLRAKSQWLRRELLEMVLRAKKGHIPSSFSCAEIAISLFYGGYLRFDRANPRAPSRDRLFISKGHASMVLYPILAELGLCEKSELERFTTADGLLHLYADHSVPGIEALTGSLGHGFGIGCGHALAGKRDGAGYRVFVLLGDGECYEGSVWEAAMFAAHYGLGNLVTIVDRNKLCILDETERCLRLDPLADKWKAFGWDVREADGHSYASLLGALDWATAPGRSRPAVIVADTVKGKGISFMEGAPLWHNRIPDAEHAERARRDLATNPIKD